MLSGVRSTRLTSLTESDIYIGGIIGPRYTLLSLIEMIKKLSKGIRVKQCRVWLEVIGVCSWLGLKRGGLDSIVPANQSNSRAR